MTIKLRRFKADYRKDGEGLGVGVGITEHTEKWDAETKAIFSLFMEGNPSNKDIVTSVFQRITYDLAENEQAILQMTRYNPAKLWHTPFKDRLFHQRIRPSGGRIYQNTLLASDALRRKTDIIEIFAESMAFCAVQQERDELIYAEQEEKDESRTPTT